MFDLFPRSAVLAVAALTISIPVHAQQAPAIAPSVIVAPAEVIGLWRQVLNDPLAAAIRAELRKNLVHLSAHDLIDVLRMQPKTAPPPR